MIYMAKGFVYTLNKKDRFCSDVEKAVYNIRNVLLTKVGTRPNLPNFGSKLSTLEYYPIDQTLIDLANLYIKEGIANSIDNVIVMSIKSIIDNPHRTITFQIKLKLQNGVLSTLSLNYNGEKFY